MISLGLFPHRLLRFEDSPWKALLLRFSTCFLVLFPWNYRFLPVSFQLENLDPALREACQALGIDPLDPSQWPSAAGVWRRWALVLAGIVLGWWMLSRLLRFMQRRWGLKTAIFPLILASVLLAQMAVWKFPSFISFSRKAFYDAVPVWGGWMEGYSFSTMGCLYACLALMLLMAAFEGLLMAIRAQRGLDEIRAQALQSHLAPHFLYNALNTLNGLVDEDPRAAQNGMERLGRLLRRLLESREKARVSLAHELSFVEDYLGLERARLGDRLKVAMEVPEELMDCAVPLLGVQVLVENAVKHAIAPSDKGGEVKIRAAREGQDLVISVIDPGQGALGAKTGLGLALQNLQSRLARPSDLVLSRTEEGHCASFRVRCQAIGCEAARCEAGGSEVIR